MRDYTELTGKKLELSYDCLPNFSTTIDVLPFKSIIGQERAEKSIELGLQISKKGYNIFITGNSEIGKTGYLIKKIEDYAKTISSPSDWCYVYNFKDPVKPIAISLNPETANEFKDSMSQFIKDLLIEVPEFFNDKNYEKQRNVIINKYEKQIIHISEALEENAKNMNFIFKQTPEEGFVFIPMNKDKEMDSEAYAKLNEIDKNLLSEAANELRLLSLGVMKETKSLEKQMDMELKQLDNENARNILEDKIRLLKTKYGTTEKIIRYLDMISEDIIENIEYFITPIEEDENKNSETDNNFFKRYEVNVIVTNQRNKGKPVIFEDLPEHSNLFGKIEYENRGGNIITDFTMIRPGSLHIANDGFIIINAYQFLSNPLPWQSLKRCLKSEYIILENSKENMEFFPITTLKPENIPLNVKVILIGDEYAYSLLSIGDPDFDKLFKIKAEFDDVIENNSTSIMNIVGFIGDYVTRNGLLHVTRDGIIEILRYSSKLAESIYYFTASMGKLTEVIDLANIFASNSNSDFITNFHIEIAIKEILEMHSLTRKKLLNLYKSKKYIVDFNGSKIGQINGLSVLDYGDCIIGQQHRITVTTYAGKDGIIDIECETEMSGSLHSKGIMILSGYIGQLLGQDISLSFNASIVFEQLYSGIEGDSASAAELLALVSSLGDIPLKQSLAITGSVNQIGEIQPIGGVVPKIEGYFDICNIFGLNGTHGVIIPETNTDELILDRRIIDAIENGLFHIYTVKTIEECLDILCDTEFKNNLPSPLMDSIKQRLLEKLEKYNAILNKR